jgi:hypothetical protein
MRLASYIKSLLSPKRPSKAPPPATRAHPELAAPPHTLESLIVLTSHPGWDTYDAPAIHAQRWFEAGALAAALVDYTATKPVIHPTGDGSIRVSWEFPVGTSPWRCCEAEFDRAGGFLWTDQSAAGVFTIEERTLAHLIGSARRRLAQQGAAAVD